MSSIIAITGTTGIPAITIITGLLLPRDVEAAMMLRSLILASLFVGIAGAAQADDVPVQLSTTPAATQKTIQTQLGDGKLNGISESASDEETVYDVDATGRDGSDKDFSVAADGTLLSVEVAPADMTTAAQTEIQNELNGGALDSIDKNLADSEISYDVAGKSKDGKEKHFTVAEDGMLLSIEVATGDTPTAVQTTIASQSGGGTVKDIEENFDRDGTNYDVEVTGGSEKSFNVAADGTLTSTRVKLASVPPAARRTIETRMGNGTILRVDKLFERERGVMPFHVEGRKDGRPFDFSVGPRGRFLGMDN